MWRVLRHGVKIQEKPQSEDGDHLTLVHGVTAGASAPSEGLHIHDSSSSLRTGT
jgi:hypothetical protein